MGLMLETNLYIIVVVLWTASIIHRSAQKQMRKASFLLGLLLVGWAITHLIEYQTRSPVLSRYVWYSYTLFELSMPLVFLWLAFAVDKPDGKVGVPKWMRILIVINSVNAALSLTNDFHLLVHPLDVTSPTWHLEYGYGVAFYFWQAGWILPLLAAVFVMLVKIGVYVRKRMLLLPLVVFLMQLVYQYAFINRMPIIQGTDRVMVNGIFVLLFVESVVRSRLLPISKRYKTLFTHSPLNMRIIDKKKRTILSSVASTWYDYDMFDGALNSYPEPMRLDENSLLFASPITGGYALWQEDITAITKLYHETEESVSRLSAAKAMLAVEEKIKDAAREELNKTKLMERLEAEITGFTIKLSTMIEQLKNNVDKTKATARIILLLCYIKRRCSLFSLEREGVKLPPDELLDHLEELAEMARLADIRIIVTNSLIYDIPVRNATLLYDFFHNVIYWATWSKNVHIVADLCAVDNRIMLRLLPSDDARTFQMSSGLISAIALTEGRYTVTDLDDAVGLCLAFPVEE